jgi:hypothetical protein
MDDPQDPNDHEHAGGDAEGKSPQSPPKPASLAASMAALEAAFQPTREIAAHLGKTAAAIEAARTSILPKVPTGLFGGDAPKASTFVGIGDRPPPISAETLRIPLPPRPAAAADVAEVTDAVIVQTDAIIALHNAIEAQAERADSRDRWLVGLTAAVAGLTVVLVVLTVALVMNGG